jgi:SAM-dependent methyltransferase
MSAVVVDQFTRQAASFARLPSHEAATELLLDMAGVGAGSEMLDVACGPGLVACAAAQRAARVVGVDLTPAMIEQAKRLQAKLALGNIDWKIGEATALPFEGGRFDAVVTRYSAHHFSDPDLVFAEMRRLAKPGARIAIADLVLPAKNAAAYDRMERLRDPSHVRTLSREELGALAVAAGLQDLKWADYRFPLDVERLMRASFPEQGNAERVRAMLEADVGVDAMGLGLQRRAGDVLLSYPVAIVSGARPS